MRTSLAPQDFWQSCAELHWALPKILKSRSCQVLKYNVEPAERCPPLRKVLRRSYHHHLSVGKFPNLKVLQIAHVLGTYPSASRSWYASHMRGGGEVCIQPSILSSLRPSSSAWLGDASRIAYANIARSRFLVGEEPPTSLRKRASRVSNLLKSVLLFLQLHYISQLRYVRRSDEVRQEDAINPPSFE